MTESVYGPSWYAETAVSAPERDRLVYDVDVDVCVVGGGLAGLTTARELARRGWSVVVLEAERVAWDASGRNTGFVAPGFGERLDAIIERIGLEHARALWVLSAGGVDYVRTAIRETAMPGVSPVEGWLKVQRIDDPTRVLAEADLIGRRLGGEVEAWSSEQVREVLKSSHYFQGLYLPGGFHIHPLNYALGLAASAEEAGARLFERTRALAIDAAGVRKRVTTEQATVRAGQVVLAGSAHLSPLVPTVSGSLLPVSGYVATTAPLGGRLAEAVGFAGAVVDSRRSGDQYRIVDGDRLMWSGRVSVLHPSARRGATLLRRDILAAYPQLGEVEIAYAWSGTMGYAVHNMPQIGEVSPGLWVATAFGRHGLNTSAMAGELIARAIVEGDDRWRLFSPYDLVYAGGTAGRVAAEMVFSFARLHDRLDEQLAWRRAAARRRQDVLEARVAAEARQRVAAEAARLAAAETERRAAADAERQAEMAAVNRAADQAAYLATQETYVPPPDEAEQEAARRAAEAAGRRRAQAERWEAELRATEQRNAEQRNAEQRKVAQRNAEAERAAAARADRLAAEEAARAATEEAAQRIALEAARLAEEAERLSAEDAAPLEAPAPRPAEPQGLDDNAPGHASAPLEPPAGRDAKIRKRRRSGRAETRTDFARVRQPEE